MKHWKIGPREPTSREFGKFLEEKRKDKGLSRAQLAEQLNFSSEYLRLIERGERSLVEGNFPKIMDILGVGYRYAGEY